jgi:hypothetical protein
MKKAVIGGALVALMAMLLVHPASAELNADGDFQFWNTEAIEGKINDQWKAYMEAEFRFGDDASEFYYQHTHLEILYKALDWLEVGAGYRQVWELDDPATDLWFTEYRPMVNVTLKHTWNDWEFSDRNRFEFRNFDTKEDKFRYRNKLKAKSPWKWTVLHINPFIADELFFEEDSDNGFNRNRFDIGVGLDFNDYVAHLTGEIFYRWQTSDKGTEWVDLNIIGAAFKFKF